MLHNHLKPPQQGFALLTVLMIVALIAMMGSQLLYEQYTGIKRSGHMLHQAQSFAVQWGVESWVKTGLKRDKEANNNDNLVEIWAEPFGPIPYEGGEISAKLIDLNRRLNLNNMIEPNASQRRVWEAVLKRYVKQNALTPRFSELVMDWVDSNDVPMPYGAESNTYLLLKPAYSAADHPMVMLSELRLLDGLQRIEHEQWLVLQQDLTTLPKVTKININTAERRVLLALTPWLNEGIVVAWMAQRLNEPARKVNDFIDFLVEKSGLPRSEIKGDLPDWMISVESEYFLLNTQVNYGESQQGISAILMRKAEQNQMDIRVLQRWLRDDG